MTENQILPEDSLRTPGFDPATSANNRELLRGFNYVLAIAIDEYQHIRRLYNCVRDVEEIIEILTTKYAFEAEQVRKLYDADATTENILVALANYTEKLGENDSLLVLYSGHGENKNNIGSWIPVDAKHFPQYLGLSTVRDYLDSVAARHILVIADSCFAGRFFNTTRHAEAAKYTEKFRSRYALTAGRDEPVLDGQPGQNSPFAEELKFILSTQEGSIGAVELADWVVNRVPLKTEGAQTPRHGELNLQGNEHGQFFFHPKNLEATIEQERFKRMEAEKARDYARQKEQEAREALEKLQLKEAELKEALGEAQAQARRIYANQLAYNSQRALRAGDRTTALRLAEFAHYYLDNNNSAVASALVEAFYFHDDPRLISRIPWNYNLGIHAGSILSVSFSPDGTKVATGSSDHLIKIWEISTGKEQLTLKGHKGVVTSVAFSPDGSLIASGSRDDTAIIWDLKSAKKILTLKAHRLSVESIAFSPDGTLLATGGGDYLAKIWNLKTGKEIFTLKGHTHELESVAFSPDGTKLATGSFDGTAKIWTLKTGKEIQTFQHQDESAKDDPFMRAHVRSVAFSPDGTMLLTGEGSTVRIWDLNTAEEPGITNLDNQVLCAIFSPDGTKIAIGCGNHAIFVGEFGTEDPLILLGHQSGVGSLAFSPDGTKLASGSSDGTVKIWDLHISLEAQLLEGHTEQVNGITFSLDGTRLMTGSLDNTAKIWELATGKTIYNLRGHTAGLWKISLSPDGAYLATSAEDKTAKIWDLKTGKTVLTLQGHSDVTLSTAFSPDGSKLATGSRDKTVKIWDLKTGKVTRTIRGRSIIGTVAFSPDGTKLASGFDSDMVKVWDLKSGDAIFTLSGGSDEDLAFSPNGTLLATTSFGNTAKIWDMKNGKTILTLESHTDTIFSVAFSPDGTKLATGALDRTAKIWNLKTGKVIFTLDGLLHDICSVAFSPDGAQLATGFSDGAVKVWDLHPDALIKAVHQRHRLAGLILPQLENYDLYALIDLHPDNESRLLANQEIWQIAAFADLYSKKIGQTDFPQQADYDRATRLYQACIEQEPDQTYFREKLTDLQQIWQQKTG